MEEKHFGDLKWELGTRYEKQTIKTDTFDNVDSDGLSFSFGGVYSLATHNKLAINFAHAERFASVEELFVDGAHLATRSYEIGDSELGNETSNNLDFSYRFENQVLRGEFNLFWNDFDDFIYAENVTAADSCASAEAIEISEEDANVLHKHGVSYIADAEDMKIKLQYGMMDWDLSLLSRYL